jgi:aryl-alcohol dehydrogenase-like predicted oxidoreductase
MNYSLLGRDVERDVIPMMRRYGLGLTVWSPLASGFLSGKYTRETLSDPANRFSGFDLLPFDKERGFALVERMRTMARRAGGSVAQVALAWLLSKKAVTLAALKLRLSGEDLALLDELTALPRVYPNWFIDQLVDAPLQKVLA